MSQGVRIRTRRLELISGSLAAAQSEIEDRSRLPGLLGVRMPERWPPPLNDEDTMRWMLDYYRKDPPDAGGWGYWYVALREDPGEPPILVGNLGFRSRPAPDGTVEIGYSILEERQRRGYASEAVAALIQWAFSHPEVKRVVAETYPHLVPSLRIMEGAGMRSLGSGAEPGVVRYGIDRAEHAARSAK